MSKSEFVGVDGCRSGWFSVGFDGSGCYELKVFPAFSELLGYYCDAKLILVDIPIGLLKNGEGRKCDKEARKKLFSPRSSSVFSAPTRQTVEQAAHSPGDYITAKAIESCTTGKGISKQAFAIAPKIAQVDKLLKCRDKDATPKVREVHPEICFWALNHENPMQYRKKGKSGLNERICVLKRTEPRTHEIFKHASSEFLRKCVASDDILDALAAAVTARCGHDRLKTIPDCPPMDCKGLPMEMVYYKPQGCPTLAHAGMTDSG